MLSIKLLLTEFDVLDRFLFVYPPCLRESITRSLGVEREGKRVRDVAHVVLDDRYVRRLVHHRRNRIDHLAVDFNYSLCVRQVYRRIAGRYALCVKHLLLLDERGDRLTRIISTVEPSCTKNVGEQSSGNRE